MAFDFPTAPSTGTQYVGPNGKMYFYDGGSWTTKGDALTPNPLLNSFKYRTIYTRGYTMGGYASGSPWQNINRTQHSTDMTTNLGDLLDFPASYKTGGFSDYNLYMYGCDAAHSAVATYVSSVSMSTETARTHSTTWDLKTGRTDAESLMNPTLTLAYITGGATSSTDKHNYVTDTMYAAGTVAASPAGAGGTNGGVSAFFGEFYGWVSVGTGACGYISWATEVWTSGVISWATDGQPKGLSSKHGFGYGSTGSYAGTTTLYKFNDVTGAGASSMTRPESAGEENWQVGQNWGYSLGSYNGTIQSNNSTKVSYLTDTCVAMGSDTMPKGHAGMSSGGCASASAMMVGGL